MNGIQQRRPLPTQFVDGIQLQNRVVDDDAARHNQPDGGHQVQRMPACPQQQQGERHIYRNLQQHDKRLYETLELRRQNEIHQQDGDEQDNDQLVQHLPIGEETSGEQRIPVAGAVGNLLHLLHEGFRPLHVVEAEGDILSVAPCGDGLQVFRRGN